MIHRQDLLDAIAECQGERNPNANTCIKLAAYYTILNHIQEEPPSYSRRESEVKFESSSEFSRAISGKNPDAVFEIIDELMDAVQVMIPKLYRATIEKIKSQN